MNDFDVIAEFYGELFARDGKTWAKEVIKTLKKYCKNKVGIDVGSGTGYFTRVIAKAGFTVTGVEQSTSMLNVALNEGGNYVKGDIRNIKGFSSLGFVTAINDVINYLKPEDLPKAFSSVNACLEKGGVFVFDYSSKERLKNVIGENLFGEDYEDFSYMWFNTKKKDGVKMDLTFFLKKQNGLYERADESFFEYFHELSTVENLLCESGFKIIELTDGDRIKIVAEKI